MAGPSAPEIDLSSDSDADKDDGPSAPKKAKSDVWDHFKLKKDDGKTLAVCKKCPNKSFAYSGGTTTLWHHLKQVHFIVKQKKPKKQSQMKFATESSASTSDAHTIPLKKQVSIEDAFAREDIYLHVEKFLGYINFYYL